MSIENSTKINKLLRDWPSGTVCLSSWLASRGISAQLLSRYKQGGWLEALGHGAVIRAGDSVDYLGGLYALQKQAGQSIHVGGRTALALHGQAQYMEMGAGQVFLLGAQNEELPTWFKKNDWPETIKYHRARFLPPDMELVAFSHKGFPVNISSPARAMFECLHLAPKHQELSECFELMEGLNTLRPQSVQALLENCASVKVKRLFLYLAEKMQHPWLEFVNTGNVNLGSGNRSLVKHGVYVGKYAITVPEAFERNDRPEI